MSLSEEAQAIGSRALSDSSESTTPGPVRTKAFRSKTSCIKCRSRKAKCGALPPDTCPYCKKNGLRCVWPEIDGRKTRPRQSHSSSSAASHQRSDLSSAAQGVPADARPVGPANVPHHAGNDTTESAWLNLLFNTSTARLPENAASTNTHAAGMQTLLGSSPLPGHGGLNTGTTSIVSSEPWGASLDFSADSLQVPFHDLASVDPGTFFRDLFDSDIGDVQMQFSANNHNTPNRSETPTDGIISIKVSRAHGRTAFVPGRIKVPFKIHVQPKPTPTSPATTMSPSDARDTYSDPAVLKHLLSVFKSYFWSQVPCVDCQELEEAIDRDPSPSFLMNCVAAAAARFSTDSRIARRGLEAAAYGDVYYERAHAMLGTVVKIPLRETVVGFTLLAYCADSSTGTWTMAGLATRMAVDLGLHRRDHPSTPPETARQNRLCFWSLLILDTIVSFGVGRETSFRPETITQDPPSAEDMGCSSTRWPFIYAADMMRSYGPLNNLLNTEVESSQLLSVDMLRTERAKIMRRYHELPTDMMWSTENLKLHNSTGQAPMFLHLHVWFHTVLSSSMVVADDIPETHQHLGSMAGVLTPSDKLSRSGAKMITEYLTLCDVFNPAIYFTQRFIGQPLFTAARVILQELHRHIGHQPENVAASERNLTTSLLSSMADGQIEVIRKVMIKTGSYWRGAAVVKEAIEHLVQGRRGEDQIWGEDESYAIEMYAWSLPGKYRVDGAQIN